MATSQLQPFDEDRGRIPLSKPVRRPVSPRIEKYDVETEIGRGDLVRVFRGFDRDLGRSVTLKVFTDLAGSQLSKRFRAEVASIAKLRSPHMIAIYGFGEHVGLPFAAMQVLEDDDLRQAIRTNRPLSLLQKLLVLWQVAEGVRAANLGGLAHVGLRPSGIALENGSQAIIQDFGIVRLNPEAESEAAFYAAPEEQTANFSPDSLCDIFAFGTICYEWLAGVHPFRASDSSDAAMSYNPPPPLRDLAPECPEELERLVHRALDPRREFRYQNLDELQDDAEPLVRELKREHSTALLADVQRLIGQAELEQAQSVLREILQFDPDNRKANRLRADVRGLLLAQTLRPRIEAILRQADQELSSGNLGRAVEHLETAFRLDNTDIEVSRRLDEARSRVSQNRRAAELLAGARQLLEQQAFREARAQASEAIEIDPGGAGASELLRAIDEALDRRDRETQIEDGIARAKSFLLLEEFDSAVAILSGLESEFPGSPLVAHWLDHVRKQAVEARKQRRLQARMREARALMAERRFNSVIVVLTELSTEFPGVPQISDLLDQACLAKERADVAVQAEAQCQELCAGNQFEQALEVLDTVLAAYPGEPTLSRLRNEVEHRWQELRFGAEVSKALSQVDWLLDQGRPDLAAQFLRDKAEEFPREELATRLAEIEKILPGWEMSRFIGDTLGRVASLEQLEQWPVALTVVEEALRTYPTAAELLDAAGRLRNRLSDRERQKKLARRLDAIRQKISIESWAQAFLLIEAAQAEFAGEPELEQLRRRAEDGRKRSESENIIREVRQCVADGEPERAQELLRRSIGALPDDAALRALEQELKADKEYREEWHTAQVLFGRRQFQKAEQILVRLESPDRPEIALLLEKVREARTASEEESFYKQGREKALKLIQQQQLEQAADLLRNLLTLFPGDPILERDLQSVQSASDKGPVVAEVETPEAVEPKVTMLREPPPAPVEAPSRTAPLTVFPKPMVPAPDGARRKLVLTGAAGLLLLASSSAAVWKLSHGQSGAVAPPAKSVSIPRATSSATAPAAIPDSGGPTAPAAGIEAATPVAAELRPPSGIRAAKSEPRATPDEPTRPFTLPPTGSRELQNQSATLPLPPGAANNPGQVPNLPAGFNRTATPTPPPTPAPEPAKEAAPAGPQTSGVQASDKGAPGATAVEAGGRAQEAQLLVSPKPILPVIARQQKIGGTVSLVATVDTAGKIKGVKVVSGHPLLSGAAVNAVLKWRYKPATLNGQPVETTVSIKVVFSPEKE